MFSKLFGRRWDDQAHDLYETLVAQARRVEFYSAGGVADTIDGRFDLVVLHAFLLLRRLGRKDEDNSGPAGQLGQAVFDLMFADFDHCLREMGVSDMGMSPKIKKMAKAFYGRIGAYDGSLEDEAALAAALERNLYRGQPPAVPVLSAMAAYVRAQARDLDDQSLDDLMKGRVRFIAPQLP
ncbi:MAG TPA: ubiquinol-cytochrome C chaperone family protein [Candidatus Sulfotelmatobacter sp.]|jgi:cytochrome b pre-mRNA-processing protein 3|nr:ubiquinol-cytochrome C chaperone family protein [Candidatus Sulfotelmatobacter sp.]